MDADTVRRKAETFAALHRAGDPLILFNCWDVATAKRAARAFPAEAGVARVSCGAWPIEAFTQAFGAAAAAFADTRDYASVPAPQTAPSDTE